MGGGGGVGRGGGGFWRGGGMYLLQSFPPLINPYLSVLCNTQQVVVKPVISAGEFHVSGKKIHLKKSEMGSEVPSRP